MRQISAAFLRDEIVRLDAIVTESDLYHPSGLKLHASGDTITINDTKLMFDLGIQSLYLREPGENELVLLKALGVQKVDASAISPGDILVEEARGPSGQPIAEAGAELTAATIDLIRQAKRGPLAVRKSETTDQVKQALDYLHLNPVKSMARSESRITRITRLNAFRLLPLLAPRARLLIVMSDDFTRMILHNTFAGAGHEVASFLALEEAQKSEAAAHSHVVVCESSEISAVTAAFPRADRPPKTMLLACVPMDLAGEIHLTLEKGANDTFARPPRPEFLLDKVRGLLLALGRRTRLLPVVQGNRREQERTGVDVSCSLKDPGSTKGLAVPGGVVLDLTERGLRMNYMLPTWPLAWAYVPGAVHPRHFFYTYAKSNTLGRDLALTLSAPGASPVQAAARIVHVSPGVTPIGDVEIIGMEFSKVDGSLAGFLPPKP